MKRTCRICTKRKDLYASFDSAGSGRYRHECKKCRSDIEKERRVHKKRVHKTRLKNLKKRLIVLRQGAKPGKDEFKTCRNLFCSEKKRQSIANFTTCITNADLLSNYCNKCIHDSRKQ